MNDSLEPGPMTPGERNAHEWYMAGVSRLTKQQIADVIRYLEVYSSPWDRHCELVSLFWPGGRPVLRLEAHLARMENCRDSERRMLAERDAYRLRQDMISDFRRRMALAEVEAKPVPQLMRDPVVRLISTLRHQNAGLRHKLRQLQ